MSREPISAERRAGMAEFKKDLLSRLGLRADARDQDVESAHNVLVEFLELAPREVKSWAVARTNDLDEAFAGSTGSRLTFSSTSQASFDRSGPVASVPNRWPPP